MNRWVPEQDDDAYFGLSGEFYVNSLAEIFICCLFIDYPYLRTESSNDRLVSRDLKRTCKLALGSDLLYRTVTSRPDQHLKRTRKTQNSWYRE
jgi:hypothetical protein